MPKAKFTELYHSKTDELLYKVVWVWCPACDEIHQFAVERGADHQVPIWDWDGDLECPTFNPSMLVTWNGVDENNQPEKKVCHSFLRDGVWDFLSDSTHGSAGQKVPMVDLPDWLLEH